MTSVWKGPRNRVNSNPYLMLDPRYEKARVEHRIVDVAVLVAIAVNADGHREVLAVEVAHGETQASWSAFLEGLVERGLSGVELAVSDAHAGMAKARRRHLPGVPWQRCQRHFLENALDKAPKALEDTLHERLKAVWDREASHEEARARLDALAADLEDEHPELAEWLEVEGQETRRTGRSCAAVRPPHALGPASVTDPIAAPSRPR